MARPKNPQKLLEEALAKGDIEGAKIALEKLKSLPKKKDKQEKNKLIVVDEDKNEDFSTKPNSENENQEKENRQALPRKAMLGITENKFNPKKYNLIFPEDKDIKKKFKVTPRERDIVDIKQIQVKCDNCGKNYLAEKWEINRSIRDGGDIDQMSNLCMKCIPK